MQPIGASKARFVGAVVGWCGKEPTRSAVAGGSGRIRYIDYSGSPLRAESARANARHTILLSEHKLAELTGTTVPAQQMAVLRALEVLHEPPKPWPLGSRDDSGRRTVTERSVKPIVVWLSDVRYLMRPERVAQLQRKLAERLAELLGCCVPGWLTESGWGAKGRA